MRRGLGSGEGGSVTMSHVPVNPVPVHPVMPVQSDVTSAVTWVYPESENEKASTGTCVTVPSCRV